MRGLKTGNRRTKNQLGYREAGVWCPGDRLSHSPVQCGRTRTCCSVVSVVHPPAARDVFIMATAAPSPPSPPCAMCNGSLLPQAHTTPQSPKYDKQNGGSVCSAHTNRVYSAQHAMCLNAKCPSVGKRDLLMLHHNAFWWSTEDVDHVVLGAMLPLRIEDSYSNIIQHIGYNFLMHQDLEVTLQYGRNLLLPIPTHKPIYICFEI